MSPSETDRGIQWARESYEALEPSDARGSYVNYLGDDEAESRVTGAYGPNHGRLREVKRMYDPENVFHLNQNVRPAS
jgi:FAD/FMN-containing dehydrogenase